MKIRSANKSDMKNVEKLLNLPELKMATGENISAKILSGYIDKKYFLVAEENKEIIGTVMGEKLRNGGLSLWYLAVKKDAREKGVGSALIDKIEKNMISEKRDWIILYAPIKNQKTIKFYKNRGYSKGIIHVEFLKYLDKK